LVGAVNGTTLSYDPTTPPGAPTTLDRGQIADFSFNGPFVVKSQDALHPFYMAAYMTGATRETPQLADDGRGDPEFVNVIPALQYMSAYTFFTDPTYSETNLVVIRAKENGAFSDVTLDCLGTLTGWQPVDSAGNYEYARVDLSTGNFAPVGNCNNGVHQMTSHGLFGLTVWGWGSAATGGEYTVATDGGFYTQYVSYTYPAGASVQPINPFVVPPTAQ
jgi:hypothetical protein